MYFSEHNKKGWRLLGVPFIFAIFLLAVPIATMTTLSFWTQDYLTLIKTITLDNYKQAWFQPVFQTLFARSLIISLTVTFITILFAFPYCLLYFFLWWKEKGFVVISYNHTILDKLSVKDVFVEGNIRV